MPTMTEECAEAICGGLHRSELFRFLGETPEPALTPANLSHAIVRGGLTTYWSAGRAPAIVRVSVVRDEPFVRVLIEWPVLKPPRVIRGSLALRVDCSPGMERSKITDASVAIVTRCLEVYRDCLGRSGFADPGKVP